MSNVNDRKMGAWIGLFVGDALGTTNEFKERGTFEQITDMVGGGPFKLNAGEWTDDGSMALCLAQSLLDCGYYNGHVMMSNFISWSKGDPYFSSNDRGCFDIGMQTQQALQKYDVYCVLSGNPNPEASGNGGLMRLAPIALFYNKLDNVIRYAQEQSYPTHSSDDCLYTAKQMGKLLHALIHDTPAVEEFDLGVYDLVTIDDVGSTGYCVDSLDFALYCFAKTCSFRDCVLMAANGGGDADTNAAIAGQIAGAFYGFNNIPKEWVKKLASKDVLFDVGYELIATSK